MKNCSKNILVQSRKFIALGGLALLAVNVSAHADLTISSGIQNSGTQTSNASNDTMINQVSNTALDHQLPSDASIAKLMQVMHIDAQIQAIVNSQQAAADILQQQSDKASVDDKNLNKRQREIATNMHGVLEQYSKILANGIKGTATKEEMTQAYVKAAKAHYSQQEVNALIQFYDTPMGQSILEKNPKVNAEFLKAALPDKDEMKQTTKQLEELLPQVKEIFKGIF